MPIVRYQYTRTGWSVYINNRNVGTYDRTNRVFTKLEHARDRYRNLKRGPGHGFPVTILQLLKKEECQTIRIQEEKDSWIIPFSQFLSHMEFRNHYNEPKAYCSLTWFSKEGEQGPMMSEQLTFTELMEVK